MNHSRQHDSWYRFCFPGVSSAGCRTVNGPLSATISAALCRVQSHSAENVSSSAAPGLTLLTSRAQYSVMGSVGVGKDNCQMASDGHHRWGSQQHPHLKIPLSVTVSEVYTDSKGVSAAWVDIPVLLPSSWHSSPWQ